MIANLRYAARNNEKVWIGGGEFSGRELTEAADKIESHDEVLTALKELVHAATHHMADARAALNQARAAIAKAGGVT